MAFRLVYLTFALIPIFAPQLSAKERISDISKFQIEVSSLLRDACESTRLGEASLKISTILDSQEMRDRWPDYTFAIDDMLEDQQGDYMIKVKLSFRQIPMTPITFFHTKNHIDVEYGDRN